MVHFRTHREDRYDAVLGNLRPIHVLGRSLLAIIIYTQHRGLYRHSSLPVAVSRDH